MRIVIDSVNKNGKTVSNNDFLKKAPQHKFYTISYSLIIELMLFIKLIQKILRTFNGASDQLRKEHYIKTVDTKVSFCLLVASIHFNGITHGLESVK